MRVLLTFTAALVILLAIGSSAAHAAGSTGSVTLEWTAPGDDSLTGRATRYDLRYRTTPIEEWSFAGATAVPNLPLPSLVGTRERFTVAGLNAGVTYYFALKSVDDAGNWSRMSNVIIRSAGGTVDVDGGVRVVAFAPPFPNPARGSATFAMSVPVNDTEVDIQAYDITGRHVRTLAKGRRSAGENNLIWDLRSETGASLAAGVYLVRARIGDTSFTRRVLIAR